jgi:hypothetical protein
MTAFVRSLFRSTRYSRNPSLLRNVRVLGIVALTTIAASALFTYQIRKDRTRGEYIVQWESTAVSRGMLRGLQNRPDAIGDYRHMLVYGGGRSASAAATGLAEIGDVSDLARLEAATARSEGEGWSELYRDEIRSATQRLSQRLDPDVEAPPDDAPADNRTNCTTGEDRPAESASADSNFNS